MNITLPEGSFDSSHFPTCFDICSLQLGSCGGCERRHRRSEWHGENGLQRLLDQIYLQGPVKDFILDTLKCVVDGMRGKPGAQEKLTRFCRPAAIFCLWKDSQGLEVSMQGHTTAIRKCRGRTAGKSRRVWHRRSGHCKCAGQETSEPGQAVRDKM